MGTRFYAKCSPFLYEKRRSVFFYKDHIPQGKKINLEEKNVELNIANWTFKIGEIAELKIANGQSLA